MTSVPRVCVVGSTNIDLTFRAARLPRPGETLAGRDCHLGFGGKGANQAVAAARQGAQVTMVSCVGRDVFGEQALENFRTHGIDTKRVRVDGERPTGIASIVVDDEAQNCILVVPGANLALSPADIYHAAEAIRCAAAVICQLEVPLATVVEAFRLARAAGVRTILNPAPAQPLPPELLQLTDLCVPNETELELLTGRRCRDTGELDRAVHELSGPEMLVTLGARGAFVAGEIVAPPPVTAIDPTGAGDTFIGCLAVALVEGLPLRDAVRRANAAAALSVTRFGTQPAIPTRAEVDTLLQAHPQA
jgi:ribokinase